MVAAEVLLVLMGLVWMGQGLGLVRVFKSFMVDRPEWIAIGSGMVALALALLWITLRGRAAA